MIHYHGCSITLKTAAAQILAGRHAFISFADRRDVDLALEVCQSFALDNGAFSAWRSGKPIKNWRPYYEWVREMKSFPSFDFAVIPDVIDGTEKDNDDLMAEWPTDLARFGAPVWHLHESLDRLNMLSCRYPLVCLGSSAEYAMVGAYNWWVRMHRAMEAVCDHGRPRCRLHGLRMLDPRIFRYLPFHSADSTNIARNVKVDQKWTGRYAPIDKAWRGLILASRIESYNAACEWAGEPQLEMAIQGVRFPAPPKFRKRYVAKGKKR